MASVNEPDREKQREKGKLYQDQMYGAKVLSPLAVAIMNCPEFERLAGLHQLGFAGRIYRGAEHTRLAHSVGTYFMARTITRRIAQNHERLGLQHPGKFVTDVFRVVPDEFEVDARYNSNQAQWRGVAEVVSAAALLHDLGHVPFAHTLEDEFAGIYQRHDGVGGPRLYNMLFHQSSELARVFSNDNPIRWLESISNEDLRKLIYVILSWKESIDNRQGFEQTLKALIEKASEQASDTQMPRLAELQEWHSDFLEKKMFHPFMSDIIGNTICSDILDYLPRDCANLGMEVRRHERLQRYFTIREGNLYPREGLRMSIMVTRKGHGGQRRDVTSEVLEIMRERYEMAERVYYHHKKAAASAMLAKLAEIAMEANVKPRDDDGVYPAPWTVGDIDTPHPVPHMVHMSDYDLIEYLGRSELLHVKPEVKRLQQSLYRALRYRRGDIYRTLMVVDTDLVREAGVITLVRRWRGVKARPDSAGRRQLEAVLATAADAVEGEVIIYCPDSEMQSKEVDVRLEIDEGKIYPLRVQTSSFAYRADVDTLTQHYKELWRAYIFVTPRLFQDAIKCKAIVDKFCAEADISATEAYTKVRTHDFEVSAGVRTRQALSDVVSFLRGLPFSNLPQEYTLRLLETAIKDSVYQEHVRAGISTQDRLSILLDASIIRKHIDDHAKELKTVQKKTAEAYHTHLISTGKRYKIAARLTDMETGEGTHAADHTAFATFAAQVIEIAISENRYA